MLQNCSFKAKKKPKAAWFMTAYGMFTMTSIWEILVK